MIGYLRGRVVSRDLLSACVALEMGDTALGLVVKFPLGVGERIGPVGSVASLFVHTHQTDKGTALYGFIEERERELFVRLTSLSGIGPATALSLMSGMSTDRLLDAIARGDADAIAAVKGFGTKRAGRLVLELGGRLPAPGATREGTEAEEALCALGVDAASARKLVTEAAKRLGAGAGVEELVKEALSK